MTDSGRTTQRRVLDAVQRLGLWQPGDTVCLAVSGGVDSMVLMHLMHRTQRAHGAQLSVVSIDHGLRAESGREVGMVEAAAIALNLPFHAVRLNLRPGPNLAERAREARQNALRDRRTDWIATGHHRDDQAETVLYHLLRGSGMRGLMGMQAKSGPWVRPLLFEPRAALQQWAEANGVEWSEDPSNPGSQRGTLRELMPRLDAVHGGASRALARSARLLASEDAWVEALVDDEWAALVDDSGLDRVALASRHPALQLRLLRRLVASTRVRAEPLESVVSGALMQGGRLDLGGGLVMVCSGGRLKVEAP